MTLALVTSLSKSVYCIVRASIPASRIVWAAGGGLCTARYRRAVVGQADLGAVPASTLTCLFCGLRSS